MYFIYKSHKKVEDMHSLQFTQYMPDSELHFQLKINILHVSHFCGQRILCSLSEENSLTVVYTIIFCSIIKVRNTWKMIICYGHCTLAQNK